MNPLLEIRGLNKAYNVPVLVDMDLSILKGEVHALIGSNGAGKTTLAKVVCGLTRFDSGTLSLDGRSYVPGSKREATEAGVVMVLQELNILPTLTIAENLFFHRLPHTSGVIRAKQLTEMAGKALQTVHLEHLDPSIRAGDLGIGQQQLIEIAAALAQDCRLLILDEPTAALTDPEIETLFFQIRRLKAKGVGILYISHRMDEIFRIADRATVLKDGRSIATHETGAVDTRTLVMQMAGRDVWTHVDTDRAEMGWETVLETRNLCSAPVVRDVSLDAHRGEILGIAGLVGSGRTETLRALFGANPVDAGEIKIKGKPCRIRNPHEAVRMGIGMIPEDRKEDGLLLDQSIKANASLATHDRYSRRGWFTDAAEQEAVLSGCRKLQVKLDHIEQSVTELSGGNQQKIVLLRWLLRESEILLLDEPTRGIDVAAKETIYQLLRTLAASGKTIIMVSSELPELMALADRIVVLSDGKSVATFTPDTWSTEAITEAAFSEYNKQPMELA